MELVNVIKFVLCYVLCLVYSAWVSFGLCMLYIFKRDTQFWKLKERPVAPRKLTSNEFGEHKFIQTNVS